MSITHHIDAIFFVAVSVSCAVIFAVTDTPTITVNVSGPSVAHQAAVPMVTVTAKRLG